MSLEDIVKALGGEMHDSGRAAIPGPGHVSENRSVSLMVERSGRLIVHSFGRSDWREVVDNLRRRRFIDAEKRLCGPGIGADNCLPLHVDTDKVAAAQSLWRRGVGLGWRHAQRTLHPRPRRPAASAGPRRASPPLCYADQGLRWRRAVLPGAACGGSGPRGRAHGDPITYLDSEGRRHKRLRTPKKIIGLVPEGPAASIPSARDAGGGGCVHGVLGEPAIPEARLGPFVDVQGAGPVWTPPVGVISMLIAGDNG